LNTGRKKRRLVVCFALFAGSIAWLCGAAQATDITGTGSWSPSVNASNLTGGPGTNLASTYASAADQITLDITNSPTSYGYRVDVQRTDIAWNGNLVLSVQRTGDGAGTGTIAGGLSYQQVDTTSSAFFTGLLDRTGVPIQLQLSGVSVAIPPGTYSTTLTFTVVDTP
jgi:hypothetical protein